MMTDINIRNTTLFISDICDRMNTFKIPHFQRGYEWDVNDVLALLDSIKNGYPIGTIILWETDTLDRDSDTWYNYVLDGQQRLTTLSEVLCKDNRWNIGYDLFLDEFRLLDDVNIYDCILPMDAILNTVPFLRFTRTISPECDNYELYIERAQKIADKFRKLNVPIVQMHGGDLLDALTVFGRINKAGKPLSDELLSRIEDLKGIIK